MAATDVQRRCRLDFAFKFGNNRRANCSREDSNLHGLPHTVLSRTRLPVPPRERRKRQVKSRITPEAQAPKVTADPVLLIHADVFARGFPIAVPCGLGRGSAADRHNLTPRFRNLAAAFPSSP